MRPYAQYGLGRRSAATLIVIDFADENLYDEALDPTDAFVEIFYNAAGTITADSSAGALTLSDSTWKSGGSGANYDIRVTPTSGTFSSGSDATATWLNLANDHSWIVTRTTIGNKSCTATVEIRDAAAPFTVRDTQTITLTAAVTT